ARKLANILLSVQLAEPINLGWLDRSIGLRMRPRVRLVDGAAAGIDEAAAWRTGQQRGDRAPDIGRTRKRGVVLALRDVMNRCEMNHQVWPEGIGCSSDGRRIANIRIEHLYAGSLLGREPVRAIAKRIDHADFVTIVQLAAQF